jgi:hypothetical protein
VAGRLLHVAHPSVVRWPTLVRGALAALAEVAPQLRDRRPLAK